MARFARFFKAARFNLIFKRMVLKWRDKTLILRPINSTTEELTKWMDDRAKQHLKWLHGPSDDDDDDDEEGAFTIIAGDVPWKIGDVPSIAGGRSKSFPASLVGRRTIIPCGGRSCQIHNSVSCIRCYHAGVWKVSRLCKCGRIKANCYLCTPDLLQTIKAKRVMNFHNKMVKMAKTARYLTSPSQIPNKTLSMCFTLADGKLAARPKKYLKHIALEVTDFPDLAVCLTHIVGKLMLAFGGHPQYSDLFAGQSSLTDDQFIRVLSARADDTGNPLEMDEIWCSASRLGDRNTVASTFTSAMMKEDQADFKRYWHWTNLQLLDKARNNSNNDWKSNSSELA